MRSSLLSSGALLPVCVVATSLALLACGSKPKQVGEYPAENATKNEEPTKWEGAAPPPPPEDAKPKASSGGVNEAAARRTDVYDKEATEVVVKRAARQVKENCGAAKDENGKATGPWGKATLQIQLGKNGHSKGVTVPAPYQGKPTGNCVEKAFTNLTFPPWGGADTEITWEVELVNPAEPAKK
ncbi:MAG: hypothetical protein JWP87_4283 [Labilithrix sp.]|nr:hypothetical protein [Labilithrix sp.]